MEWEVGVSRHKLLYIKRINNKVWLQRTLPNILRQTRKECFKKEHVYMCN